MIERPAERHLETERLLLRPFTNDDFEAVLALHADPEVMRFLGGVNADAGDVWRRLASYVGHWELRGYGLYAVERKADGAFCGRVGFLNPHGWPGFEIGWTLARSAWGHGYATEAALACREHAFEHMGRPEILSLIAPANSASIAVADRIGETRAESTRILNTDVDVWRLDRPTWQTLRST